MPTVAKVFNLDEIRCNYVEISKTLPGSGEVRTWQLRDDVDTATMIRGFEIPLLSERLVALRDRLAATGETVSKETIAGEIRAYQADVRDFFLDIARWSLSEADALALTDALTHEQRDEIVYHFFTTRFGITSSASPSASSEQVEDAQAVTAPVSPHTPGPSGSGRSQTGRAQARARRETRPRTATR
ncbi:MAG TPA: hypothetical protein VKQ30_01210 [Ktedonobacterales bacterium]|nr:hypothetical protein [Ktedonobacterales bacterium]